MHQTDKDDETYSGPGTRRVKSTESEEFHAINKSLVKTDDLGYIGRQMVSAVGKWVG